MATPVARASLRNAEDWLALIGDAGLKGPVRELASHSGFCAYADGLLSLSLPEACEHLRSDKSVSSLAQQLAPLLGSAPRIRFEKAAANANGETLHDRNQRQRSERQSGAESSFMADPIVAQLIGQGGKVVPDSIKPLDQASER